MQFHPRAPAVLLAGQMLIASFAPHASAQGSRAGSEVKLPVMGSVFPARYPPESEAAGQEGIVTLRLTIDRSGTVVRSTVAISSGFPLLDESALESAGRMRFQPGTVDGAPREMAVTQPVAFHLNAK
jgi:TonB family protein